MVNKEMDWGILGKIKRFVNEYPVVNYLLWTIAWAVLIVLYKIIYLHTNLDVPKWFPISMFYGPKVNISGLPYAIIFLIILGVTLWKIDSINNFVTGLIGSAIIVLGNLIQGNFYNAFISPFVAMHNQYYYDAVKVNDWVDWLARFNKNQLTLADHSQTHPPFAVLIQKLFLWMTGDRVTGLALGVSLFSIATIFLMYFVFKYLGVESKQSKLLLLLFSVVPAINIYSIVCLDGMVLTTSTIFLLGVVILLTKPQQKWWGNLLLAFGLITTSLLTFSSLFLFGFGMLLGVYEFLINKKKDLLFGMLFGICLFLIVLLLLKFGFHYDHLQGFLTSMQHEKLAGDDSINMPLNYLVTRVEDVGEILLFLSIGALSVIFPIKMKNWQTNNNYLIAFTAIFGILLTFMSGTFRTGETARSCLFVFPFLIPLLLEKDSRLLKYVIITAGVQTVLMQFFGGYFW